MTAKCGKCSKKVDDIYPPKPKELHLPGLRGLQSAKATGQAEREVWRMTNYEMIKQSSIENMALTIMCPNEMGLAEIECSRDETSNCGQCCLDWLQEESE